MLKVNRGIDITDTTYSLGNYAFFDGTKGVWFLITFISNVTGKLMTLLPFGNTMLGMNVYSSLIIAVLALFGYRFFRTKMPAWLAFIAEMVAIGMCWIPSVILYNYLTYMFLLFASVFMFRGLVGTNKTVCLFIAGIFLGINCFVRFPNNGLEVVLIVALWAYGVYQKKSFQEVLKQTGLCVLGYLLSFIAIISIMTFMYGKGTFMSMIQGVLSISGSASDYTFGQMLISILDAYWHGAKWAIYMVVCVLPGIPFFILWKDKYVKLRKYIYCVCIALLFIILGRWGMFNFKYFQKESALQWGAIFLIVSICINVWMILSRYINYDWKLIGIISLIIILITPLGSNNYIWPNLNNLFFVAPVTFWMVYKFVRWGRNYLDINKKVPLFAPKAMLMATVIAFSIQALGVGCFYVFMDGEDGKKLDTYVTNNAILKGIKTNSENARVLSELSQYFNDNADKYKNKELILYGNIPGISYCLNKDIAINTSWPDLASNPVEDMEKSLNALEIKSEIERPLIIISKSLFDIPDNSIKFELVQRFIDENSYSEVFINDRYVVYE